MLPYRILTPLLKLFYRLLYYEFAWSYDLVAWFVSAGHWQAWVLALLPYLTGESLLELGHGPGHLQQALAAQGRNIFGLDRSLYMSRQAQRRLSRAGLVHQLSNGYAQMLPYPANAFDQVFATFPSEYILSPATLAEILRTLKPGGEFTVLPGAWVTGLSLPERLAATLFRLTGQSLPSEESLFYPAADLLKQAGFVQVEWETILLPGSKVLVVRAYKPI